MKTMLFLLPIIALVTACHPAATTKSLCEGIPPKDLSKLAGEYNLSFQIFDDKGASTTRPSLNEDGVTAKVISISSDSNGILSMDSDDHQKLKACQIGSIVWIENLLPNEKNLMIGMEMKSITDQSFQMVMSSIDEELMKSNGIPYEKDAKPISDNLSSFVIKNEGIESRKVLASFSDKPIVKYTFSRIAKQTPKK